MRGVVYRFGYKNKKDVWGVALLLVFVLTSVISSVFPILETQRIANAAIPARTTDDAWYVSVTQDAGYSASAGCNLDQYGYCLRNCVSYVAQRLGAAGVKSSDFTGLGNAVDWYSKASGKGVPVGSKPKVGSIAYSGATATNSFGHVAFVTAVNTDGSINVRSYNGGNETPQFENNTKSYSRFIYFSNVVSGSSHWSVGSAKYKGSKLTSGQALYRGQYLASGNLQYALILQSDGNLVLYRAGKALWNSRTAGSGADRLVMQGDGNLVLYAGGTAKWHSKTGGSGANRAILQTDGNFVVYAGSSARWHTKTGGKPSYSYFGSDRLTKGQTIKRGKYLRSGNGKYAILLQPDGNLVLYSAGYHVLWNSKTSGKGVDRLVMQGDGNLVLYDGGAARWHTKSRGSGADRVIMQGDGNFVLYAGGTAKWHTKTSGKI